jgi:hypothetical protein
MASHQTYEEGNRDAWLEIFRHAIHGIGRGGPEWDMAKLIVERERAIKELRWLCGLYGDNDWDSNLHLCDILDKHLARHLRVNKDKIGE